MTNKYSIEDEGYKAGTKHERYLIAPFDEETLSYNCECTSCDISGCCKYLLARIFIAGLFIPILWIGNIGLYIYTQCYLSNEPTHSQVPQEELPTMFEVELKLKRTRLHLSSTTMDELERLNCIEVKSGTQECTPHTSETDNYLERHRNDFLRHMAVEILCSHDTTKAYYNKWLMFTTLAISTYAVATSLIVVAYVH